MHICSAPELVILQTPKYHTCSNQSAPDIMGFGSVNME